MDVTVEIKVEKLNNTNFHVWKLKIELFLWLRELEYFIKDDSPTMDADKYREWCKNNQKAATLIGLSLFDEHLKHVQGVHSANEMRQYTLNLSNATLCSTS